MFITFEGGEGVGKSTQIRLLQAYLEQIGIKTILTREPGGTELAEKLRDIIISKGGIKDSLLEYTIIAAARRDHIINLIKPSLQLGKYVLCDRFYDSSIVYQGLLKGLDLNVIKDLHDKVNGGILPDLTIVLDLPIDSSQERLKFRNDTHSHYDAEGESFHKKVRNGFLTLAEDNPKRVKVINASGSIDEVHKRIVKLLMLHLQV